MKHVISAVLVLISSTCPALAAEIVPLANVVIKNASCISKVVREGRIDLRHTEVQIDLADGSHESFVMEAPPEYARDLEKDYEDICNHVGEALKSGESVTLLRHSFAMSDRSMVVGIVRKSGGAISRAGLGF